MNLKLDLCLSDLDRSKITTASNGKKYVRIYANERKKPDQQGNTHYLSTGKNDAGERMFCGAATVAESPYDGPVQEDDIDDIL